MSRTCVIIVCDHGLGHARRSALIAKQRERAGEQVTLLAPLASIGRLRQAMPSIAGLQVHDFVTRTSPQRIRRGLPEAIDWLTWLPDMDSFDTVISDNLIEILEIRPDAQVYAQFFWHDVLGGVPQAYVNYCEDLLARYRPSIFGCDLFAMDAVRRQPGFQPTGLYTNPELVEAVKGTQAEQRTDLLITGGSTGAVREQLSLVISELQKKGPDPYELVHVDPELLRRDSPPWMQRADFTVEMYCRLRDAICRPGLGVVTDLLTVGCRINPVFERGNAEMRHNARVIDTLGARY